MLFNPKFDVAIFVAEILERFCPIFFVNPSINSLCPSIHLLIRQLIFSPFLPESDDFIVLECISSSGEHAKRHALNIRWFLSK